MMRRSCVQYAYEQHNGRKHDGNIGKVPNSDMYVIGYYFYAHWGGLTEYLLNIEMLESG